MNRIRKIIQQYLRNIYSEGVQGSFISWYRHNAPHTEIERAFWESWNQIPINENQNIETSLDKIQKKLFTEPSVNTRKISIYTRLYRIAVILLIPMLSLGGAYLYVDKKMSQLTTVSENIKMIEVFVPNGELRTIVLPDSSIVNINSGSVLFYPAKFAGDKRSIYLYGEASFAVKHNSDKPFIVATTDMDIEVLGTTFNISSYVDSENTSTTLESGKVHIRLKNTTQDSIILKPDEQITYNRNSGEMQIRQVNAKNVLGWKEGHFVVEDISIKEVFKVLERKFGISIYLNSNKFGDQKITAKFTHGEELSDYMRIIKRLVPELNYRIEEKKVYIY